MRVVLGTLLAGLVLVATVCAGEDAAKKELKKLNGTWIAIALERDGESGRRDNCGSRSRC